MKTLLVTTNNKVQIVLTPETYLDKKIVEMFPGRSTMYDPNAKETPEVLEAYRGSFADSQAGYVRQYNSDDSLIFVIENKKEE